MLYDLSTPTGAHDARARLEELASRGCLAELTEKKPKRSLNQNAYLHLILGYFASQTGNTLQWVKQQYYKRLCSPDLFIGERDDRFLGRVRYVKSSASLDTGEMTLSIERFRNWAAAEAGISLPEPSDEAGIREMQIEAERYRTYM